MRKCIHTHARARARMENARVCLVSLVLQQLARDNGKMNTFPARERPSARALHYMYTYRPRHVRIVFVRHRIAGYTIYTCISRIEQQSELGSLPLCWRYLLCWAGAMLVDRVGVAFLSQLVCHFCSSSTRVDSARVDSTPPDKEGANDDQCENKARQRKRRLSAGNKNKNSPTKRASSGRRLHRKQSRSFFHFSFPLVAAILAILVFPSLRLSYNGGSDLLLKKWGRGKNKNKN